MTTAPATIAGREMATRALDVMESRRITSLVVVDGDGRAGGGAPARLVEDRDDMRERLDERRVGARCQALRLVLSDVDGVLTDGRLTFLADGSETKSFHIKDGLGIVLAHRAGLRTGLVSVDPRRSCARAQELGMSFVKQGFSDSAWRFARSSPARR